MINPHLLYRSTQQAKHRLIMADLPSSIKDKYKQYRLSIHFLADDKTEARVITTLMKKAVLRTLLYEVNYNLLKGNLDLPADLKHKAGLFKNKFVQLHRSKRAQRQAMLEKKSYVMPIKNLAKILLYMTTGQERG